jgi:coproporphyrinogen III oxidase
MTTTPDDPAVGPVREYFMALQDRIVDALEAVDGQAAFRREHLDSPGGGSARPRVLADGRHIEKAAVQFTHSVGERLPPAATATRPELADRPFEATAISMIVHPRNPYAPTTHLNLRYFHVDMPDAPFWYFGGGFDLTPYYGFEDDARHWHATARAASPDAATYHRLKAACDEYFYLPHRKECRGIGGVFFDDWRQGGFAESFAFTRAVGDAFLDAYVPILQRRIPTPYGDRERQWQLIRRGRYAEFNLVWDRGTKYGLQSGRRIESVLASMPPLCAWAYDHHPAPGSPEEKLLTEFLPPRDWLA